MVLFYSTIPLSYTTRQSCLSKNLYTFTPGLFLLHWRPVLLEFWDCCCFCYEKICRFWMTRAPFVHFLFQSRSFFLLTVLSLCFPTRIVLPSESQFLIIYESVFTTLFRSCSNLHVSFLVPLRHFFYPLLNHWTLLRSFYMVFVTVKATDFCVFLWRVYKKMTFINGHAAFSLNSPLSWFVSLFQTREVLNHTMFLASLFLHRPTDLHNTHLVW